MSNVAPWERQEAKTRWDMPALSRTQELEVLQEPPSVGRHRKAEPRAPWRETARHRVITTLLVTAAMVVLYVGEQLLWSRNAPQTGDVAAAWSWMSLLWVVAVFPALFEVIGLYVWKAPSQPPCHVKKMVNWRIVSRGINTEALTATIAEVRAQMHAMPLFPYRIEVVMDSNSVAEGLPPQGGDLAYIIVPDDYKTPLGTKYKGRALNFALWNSPIPGKAWILHLDEESRPTPGAIIGIANAIREEEELRPGRPRVGQGTIVYHRRWEKNPFFTLSDCIRTGSDVGRLFLALKVFHAPLFGMHGSYILIRNDVEKSVGLDLGPKGNLTEDAYFGTLAMDDGVRFRWVDGYVAEQCTENFWDFTKQRRRWFNGMWITAFRSPAKLRWRFTMIVSMLAWASAPLAWVYTIGHFAHGGYISPDIRMLANFSLAVYIATTIIGLRVNLREHGKVKWAQKVGWSLTWLVCLPVLSFMEAAAIVYAMVKPARIFDVVKK